MLFFTYVLVWWELTDKDLLSVYTGMNETGRVTKFELMIASKYNGVGHCLLI
jgi:hypothetical protein